MDGARKNRTFNFKVLCLTVLLCMVATGVVGFSGIAAGAGPRTEAELSNPISPDDYQIVKQHGRSYLALNSAGKKLLYLEGDAYERGYAEGALCPEAVTRLCDEFAEGILMGYVRMFIPNFNPDDYRRLMDTLWIYLDALVEANIHYVPDEFVQEMRGIADACRDLGYDGVTFNKLLRFNVGFDALLSLLYPIAGAIYCNGYAAFGNATTGGDCYHGRDFMFSSGGGWADESLLMVQNPTRGNAFATSVAPGFVGVPTGMNDQGVSIGTDMVPSMYTRPVVSGAGTLMLCRQVTQFADSLQEGIDTIRYSDRAVSWLYLITDGQEKSAAVLETVANGMIPPAGDAAMYFASLVSSLLKAVLATAGVRFDNPYTLNTSWLSQLNALGNVNADPDRGVKERRADYEDTTGGQMESHPDLVCFTNHFITPEMARTNPGLLELNVDSRSRYVTLIGLLSEAYGSIDRPTAMWLIDFLNPGRSDYYGTNRTQPIGGHHVLIDNTNLELWSLHGRYDDPWAHVDLTSVISGATTTNAPPKAEAGPDKRTKQSQQVAFSAAGSSDPEGTRLRYRWSFGDGTAAEGLAVGHTYKNPGVYTVKLTVVDAGGAVGTDTCKVTVERNTPLLDLIKRLFRW